ncbi:MAG: hypothetical protein KC587_06965, partial [Nitrospira sp.]|nr:hypothetical protein [Nitrospira sp.]
GIPKEYPAQMPHIDQDPIGLSKQEIYSVIAFLQKMSGEPISIKVEDIMESGQKTASSLKVASVSSTLKSQLQNLADR